MISSDLLLFLRRDIGAEVLAMTDDKSDPNAATRCLHRAQQCEEQAARMTFPESQQRYHTLARQWRHLATHLEQQARIATALKVTPS
jgi:hypothetical protein